VRRLPRTVHTVDERVERRSARENARIIVEHAVLDVISGKEQSFERAFAEAKSSTTSRCPRRTTRR
jgi:hypothetical protein